MNLALIILYLLLQIYENSYSKQIGIINQK